MYLYPVACRSIRYAVPLVAALMWLWSQPVRAEDRSPFIYLSPRADARYVSPGTTIAFRLDELVHAESLDRTRFTVRGSESGLHTGRVVVAQDQRTTIFEPHEPFVPGEEVEVRIGVGSPARSPLSIIYKFTVSRRENNDRHVALLDELSRTAVADKWSLQVHAAESAEPLRRYATIPDDFPAITVTVPASDTDEGYVFLSNFNQAWLEAKPYLLILDNLGEPIYFKHMTDGRPIADFKKQPNGLLTYWDAQTGHHHAMDSSYTVVAEYEAGNGYDADFHDLQILPNGNRLMMIYDAQPVDMSQVVSGGAPTATVVGLVIQELTVDDTVVFEWRSWDHIPITDTIMDVTKPYIDYVHGNAVELDNDGHVLFSSRHLSEITKVDRTTGEILWRLGGKSNQFSFVNGGNDIALQHDVRRLANGNITVFNNRGGDHSCAVEYELDEINKVATVVWRTCSKPGAYSYIMGNAQRLAGGNTLIGWASTYPTLTEVKPNGEVAYEMTLAKPIFTYRAFRFPWEGRPKTEPALVVSTETPTITLRYSWNGATGVSAYQVYGDKSGFPTTPIDVQPRSGFETTSIFTDMVDGPYTFRVVPLNRHGVSMLGNVVDLSTSTKSASTDVVFVGDGPPRPITYTITLRNVGDRDLASGWMTDTLPNDSSEVAVVLLSPPMCSSGTCSYDKSADEVVWTGSVPVSGTVVLTYSVEIEVQPTFSGRADAVTAATYRYLDSDGKVLTGQMKHHLAILTLADLRYFPFVSTGSPFK